MHPSRQRDAAARGGQIDPLAVEQQLEAGLRAADGQGSRAGAGGARSLGRRLDRLAGRRARSRRGRPRGLGLGRHLRVRQGGAQPGDLPLHLRAAGGRDPIAAVAQIAGERLDRLDGVAERDVRLADVEEDGELRADGVRGVELAQRPLVPVLAGELQPLGVVGARLAPRIVGAADPRRSERQQRGEQRRASQPPPPSDHRPCPRNHTCSGRRPSLALKAAGWRS